MSDEHHHLDQALRAELARAHRDHPTPPLEALLGAAQQRIEREQRRAEGAFRRRWRGMLHQIGPARGALAAVGAAVLVAAGVLLSGGAPPRQPSLPIVQADAEPPDQLFGVEPWISATDLLLISETGDLAARNAHLVVYDPITLEILP